MQFPFPVQERINPKARYIRVAVNDLDASLVTFFRVLRDQPDELTRLCSLTPYSRSEFAAALVRSNEMPDADQGLKPKS